MSIENAINPVEFESYFRLLWLLVLFVSLLMVFLCYLYLAARKARERESKKIAFSSLILEGQETERMRIASELHDSVLQDLKDKDSIARIREICNRLMSPDFTRYSLRDSLISLCDSFNKRTGIECVVEITDDPDFESMSGEQPLHLYRIAQEALNNAEKHSKAKKVMLVARFAGEDTKRSLLFSVSDDGVGLQTGFSGDFDTTKGLGMKTMRHRATLLGGGVLLILSAKKATDLWFALKYPLTRRKHEQHFYFRRPPCNVKRACLMVRRHGTLAGFWNSVHP